MNDLTNINWLVFALVALGLVIFGLGVNALVGILERLGALEGRRALLVVLGVFGTLVGAVFVVGLVPAVVVGLLFVASGIPMIGGEWIRDAQDRQNAAQALAHGLESLEDAES